MRWWWIQSTRRENSACAFRLTQAESCQNAGRAPRGHAFRFMLGQHFRLDLNRGSNHLTQQALLDLQLEGFSIRDLEKFVERIEYVLNGIPQSYQPNEITKFTWLYSRLKRCKILQRHIDRIRDSRETSHVRSVDEQIENCFDRISWRSKWRIHSNSTSTEIQTDCTAKGRSRSWTQGSKSTKG